jgi:hypothetical protein
MYLYARKYVSGVDYSRENEQVVRTPVPAFTEIIGAVGLGLEEVCQDFPSVELHAKVGYWRKANQIHKWFVDNVQEGVDDCGKYFFEREKLVELLTLCQQISVDKSLAGDLLPSESGFFFGSTEYDEWYYEQIDDTIAILERILNNPKFETSGLHGWDFYYQSSW